MHLYHFVFANINARYVNHDTVNIYSFSLPKTLFLNTLIKFFFEVVLRNDVLYANHFIDKKFLKQCINLLMCFAQLKNRALKSKIFYMLLCNNYEMK